jgi:branched-chain amino acid transport system substrate-binding protein
MSRPTRRFAGALTLALLALAVPRLSMAQPSYDSGASASEIRIGNTMAYSGPVSALGSIGKVETAYFNMLNAAGGINGRKVSFLSNDDGYNPARTVEQIRKLVEGDQVLATFGMLGTPSNLAVQKYLNGRKVPQLFVATGANRWDDPKGYPWTIGFQPSFQAEARIYGAYILAAKPDARIGVLYQNDDFGKDYLIGLKAALGARAASMIVAEQSYEVTDPTVDQQILALRQAGADVFVDVTSPKFGAQAIRKLADLGWKPLHIIDYAANSVGAVLKAAGLQNAEGLVSAAFLKDPSDPGLQSDPEVQAYLAFLARWMPEADRSDALLVYGYVAAQSLAQVLRQCGDELTRENVMRQAANLRGVAVPMLLPGIRLNTAPTDFAPIGQMQLMRFDGTRWQLFGTVIDGKAH